MSTRAPAAPVSSYDVGGDSSRAIALAWVRLLPSLRHVVGRMTPDSDEQEDYLQEALIHLWTLDVTRFDLRLQAERNYLRRMLVNHMWNVRRAADRRTRSPLP